MVVLVAAAPKERDAPPRAAAYGATGGHWYWSLAMVVVEVVARTERDATRARVFGFGRHSLPVPRPLSYPYLRAVAGRWPTP